MLPSCTIASSECPVPAVSVWIALVLRLRYSMERTRTGLHRLQILKIFPDRLVRSHTAARESMENM